MRLVPVWYGLGRSGLGWTNIENDFQYQVDGEESRGNSQAQQGPKYRIRPQITELTLWVTK
ncbi:hypothetical protein DRQ53_09855 [bacterium]|nr:MAG: hypothetical protein DRQ32_05325 [bacterium]RKZ15125.1 MAG: hypothetical protein DRQ53_09855 [bacterium]